MRIYSWNVNGLRAVMGKGFFDFISECKPDVLCLQETRIDPSAAEGLPLPFKYRIFSYAEKKGYSGTAILSNIEPGCAGEVALDGHPNEGRITYADFGGFRLVNAYVPNSQNGLRRLKYRREWDADFLGYLNGLGNTVVCGDLNVAHNDIDLARPESNRMNAGFTDEERSDFSKLLSEAGLSDVWRERNPGISNAYTWWSYRGGARSRNVGWRIDYFLVSRTMLHRVGDCGIAGGTTGSDHCPVYLSVD